MGSCERGRTKIRQSRALDKRSFKLTMAHEPTKIEVKGEIPEGHYARKKMRDLHNKLFNELYGELERKVARKIGIPAKRR